MRVSDIKFPKLNETFALKAWWLLTSRLIPTLVLFLITLAYSRHLSYTDYAQFQSSWMYSNIISLIISFGAPALILATDYCALHSYIEKNKLSVAFFLVSNVVLVASLFFLIERESDFYINALIILIGIMQSFIGVAEALLLKWEKMSKLLVQNTIYALLLLGWLCFFLFYPFDLKQLLIGLVILFALKSVLLVEFHKKPISTELASSLEYIRKQWFFLGIAELIGLASKWIDKIFILYISTPTAFAVYFNGSIEIPMFSMLISAVGALLTVNISKHVSKTHEVARQYKEVFYLLSSIVFPLFAFFLFNAADLFFIFFKEKYNASVPIFIATVCMLPVRINNYTVILQCIKKSDHILKGSLLDLFLALFFMLPLYKALGPLGVAISITLATYFQAGYYLYQSKKALGITVLELLPMGYLSGTILIALVVTALGFYLLLGLPLFWRVGGAIIVCMTLITTMLYFQLNKKTSKYYNL